MLDGTWAKRSNEATDSYLISSFGENNLDQAIGMTKRAGLKYLYTDSCFETWGHFKLNPQLFPDGWASMKRCVERAKAQGVRLGVHTLSNFITTNDPYVTPVPDKRLAVVGESKLEKDIDSSNTELTINDPTFFNQMENNSLRTVRVGDELIQYKGVSKQTPWTLEGCKRGAFGTVPSDHRQGETIGKLMDHPYQVFLTNSDLSIEVARKIANLFNETGLRQLSFDGLEGNWSTGMGQYGRSLFTKTWYDHLSPALKGDVINDASGPAHFFWHIYTRMNWGEPWYAGFRESQTQYRLANQRYFQRNLMPGMLGWFQLSPDTSLEDAEWLLARAAGFDAGFSLVTSPEKISANGDGAKILTAASNWESARHLGAFSESQKSRLQDIRNEFHLKPTGTESWSLIPVSSTKLKFSSGGIDELKLINPYAAQPLQCILQVPEGTTLINIKLSIDGKEPVAISETLQGPCALRLTGESSASIQDSHWNTTKTVPVQSGSLMFPPGNHHVQISATVSGSKPTDSKIEFRLFGPPELIKVKQ
jgi:hypothetical protein